MQLDFNGRVNVQELELKFKPNRKHSQIELHSPADVHKFLAPRLADEPREKFVGLFLNPTNEVAAYEVISQGTSDSAPVSPREAFKAALLSNSPAVIFAHNHPSGSPNPSPNDFALAQTLKEAAELLDIKILDFLVITRDRYYSFADSEPDFNIKLNKGGAK